MNICMLIKYYIYIYMNIKWAAHYEYIYMNIKSVAQVKWVHQIKIYMHIHTGPTWPVPQIWYSYIYIYSVPHIWNSYIYIYVLVIKYKKAKWVMCEYAYRYNIWKYVNQILIYEYQICGTGQVGHAWIYIWVRYLNICVLRIYMIC